MDHGTRTEKIEENRKQKKQKKKKHEPQDGIKLARFRVLLVEIVDRVSCLTQFEFPNNNQLHLSVAAWLNFHFRQCFIHSTNRNE